MKSFYIKTLGCKVNQYDSFKLKNLLLIQDFKYSLKNPDYIIINTCAVTKTAIKKDWQAWQGLKNKFPKAKVIIMGCWPQIYKSEKFKKADMVFKVSQEEEVFKKILTDSNIKTIKQKAKKINYGKQKSRYFLKIADGCDQFCSYCIIPFSRGRISSRSMQEIIEEAKVVENEGYYEIVLTAIHLGAYGKDKKQKNINLNTLVKKLLKETKNIRFRLSSIEVNEINNELIKIIKDSKGRICQHLHIPLQSGSEKILKLMKRPYSKKYFRKKLEKLRLEMPKIAISTDIIVGFPGESDEKFKESYQFCEELLFSKIHVFPYSEHELTRAAKLKDKLEEETKKQRSAILRKLSDKMALSYKLRIINNEKNLNLLIERKESDILEGKSEFYFDLKFKLKNKKIRNIKIGQLLKVKKEEIKIIN
jgi:threonylcarbamoyladenosine tRNA methylthiotransferase MtaB